ncbi:BatA domain-containing protein [Undibacterium fentianense]|uniref:BatA domain-containing protein n=1 Tax=Undibacterium fentianense TaxID=2828728 RepID=A0A941E389_9BURK|nr:BatA domain-containing protein [Undibacterium fentianense]MBR7800407.1 BatA domain-containing protein [Undibacterium fentianense]
MTGVGLLGLSPLWWWLLPLLGLPIWWHRQRRQTQKMRFLASAQFLAATPPQLLRVWRWRDLLLLLLRCLMMIVMLMILTRPIWSWRGDTVFVGAGLDKNWVAAEIEKAGFGAATQQRFCASGECELKTEHLLFWLVREQNQWRSQARWLILARESQLPMPAQRPELSHSLAIRIAPTTEASTASEKQVIKVALKTARVEAWQGLFRMFEFAGTKNLRFILSDQVEKDTWLAIWDQRSERDPNWTAPLVWSFSAKPDTSLSSNGARSQRDDSLLRSIALQSEVGAGGVVWRLDSALDWPLYASDLDRAKNLFEALQGQRSRSQQMNMRSQDVAATQANTSLFLPDEADGYLREILVAILALLFILERSLAHVRRA